MMEVARDRDGEMPRIFGVNHHPEIVNRPRQLTILRKRMERGRGHARVVRRSAWPRSPRTSTTTAIARCTSRPATRCWRRCATTCTARPCAVPSSSDARLVIDPDRVPILFRASADQVQADRGRLAAVLPKPPFDCDLTLERELEEFRAAQAEAGVGLGDAHRQRGPAEHLGRRALADARCRGADEARRRLLLRGAAAVPADPAAQPARARGVRDVAAGAPADARLLPAPARRRARQPRARAAHDALRVRRLVTAADAEDPGAAAAVAADPLCHPRP